MFFKFVQAFIGPAIDDNLAHHLERMHSYGYITLLSEEDDYTCIMKKFDPDWNMKYDPIAPLFVEHVRNNVLPEEMTELGQLTWKLEDMVREILINELRNRHSIEWKDHIGDYVRISVGKNGQFEYLVKRGKEMHAQDRGIEVSKLEVLNFAEYGKIIEMMWDDMKKYFSSYENTEQLMADLIQIKDVRNSYAHRTQRILTNDYIEKMTKLCKNLIADIEKGAA